MSTAEATAIAPSTFEQHPDGMGPADLAAATLHRRPGDLPLAAARSGDLLAMGLPHDLFDGAAAWFEFAGFLSRAAGVPSTAKPRPVLQRPLLATLRQAELTRPRALQDARAARRAAERSVVPAALPRPLRLADVDRRTGWSGVYLDAADVAWLDRSRPPQPTADGGPVRRTSRGMKLVELVLVGLQAGSLVDGSVPVRMPIDLRRYAPRGTWVSGPFASSYPLGSLDGTDNTAAALTGRLTELIRSKGPLAALVGDLAGLAKNRVRDPLRRAAPSTELTHVDVNVSLLPPMLPDGFWASSGDKVNAAFQFHPLRPTTPFIQIGDLGEGVTLSLWDESHVIDPDAFERAVRASLAARIENSSTVRREA